MLQSCDLSDLSGPVHLWDTDIVHSSHQGNLFVSSYDMGNLLGHLFQEVLEHCDSLRKKGKRFYVVYKRIE